MIVIQVLYNHLTSEQPIGGVFLSAAAGACSRRQGIKKAHPTNQMSFKYFEVFF
jgi:hypothetical protein